MIKPYLKWAGGKRQLLAEIRKQLPTNMNDYTYYEPFVGAGAVFFDLLPTRAVINDFNVQLVLTYKAIRKNLDELILLLKEHQEKHNKEYYYRIRDMDRDEAKFNALSDVDKAARLIFLNKTCFNGLYRVNSKGFFNVPYGRYKNPVINEETLLRQINTYLNTSEITILNVDFEHAVSTADKQSFVYFDPPYHSPDKTNFTAYQANGFGEDEQERLCKVMTKMTKRGVKCLLSNSDTDLIRALYSDSIFEIIPVQARRVINSSSTGRGPVNELLIKNYEN